MSAVHAAIWAAVLGAAQLGEIAPHWAGANGTIRVWGVQDGLPQSSVTAIAEGVEGYLWLGTFAGLVRFDGLRFEVYDRRTHPGLPSDRILSLHFDRAGRLWIGTERGVACWARGVLQPVPAELGVEAGHVRGIVEDDAGRLVFHAQELGGVVLDGDEVRVLPLPEQGDPRASHVAADLRGVVYAASERGLWALEGGRRWRPAARFPPGRTLGLGARRAGGVWVLHQSGLFTFLEGTLRPVDRRSLAPNDAGRLVETDDGCVWKTSATLGLRCLRPGGGEVPVAGLPGDNVRVVHPRAGELWIGTDGAGLVRARRALFSPEPYGAEPGVVHQILSLGPGRLLLATHGSGLLELSAAGPGWPWTTLPAGDAGRWVRALHQGTAGALWVGFYESGASRIQEGVIRQVELPSSTSVRAIAEAFGRVWLASEHGLYHVDRAAEAPALLWPLGQERTPKILDLAPGPEGLYVATETAGLWLVTEMGALPVRGGPGPERAVLMAKLDASGRLWCGLDDGEMLVLDDGRAAQLGPPQGLPLARYQDLVEDGSGRIWLASNRGVVELQTREVEEWLRAERVALRVERHGAGDGLPSEEVNAVELAPGRVGGRELLFATSRGVARLDPQALGVRSAPRLWLESLEVIDADGQVASVALDAPRARVRLPPRVHHLELRFTSLGDLDPEHSLFRVRMSGEHGVERISAERQLELWNLVPGHYQIEVRRLGGEAVPATLSLELEPALWEAGWVRAALPALGVLLLIAFYRRRLAVVHERLEQERRLKDALQDRDKAERKLNEAQRLESLGLLAGSIAHDFNNLLTTMLLEVGLLKEDGRSPTAAITAIERAAHRARELCAQMLAYAGRSPLDVRSVDLHALLRSTASLIRGSLPRGAEVDLDLPLDPLGVRADRGQLSQVLMNLLLNAAEAYAGGRGRVKVRVSTLPRLLTVPESAVLLPAPAELGYVAVEVEDQGHGMSSETRARIFDPFFTTKEGGRGLGLAAVLGILRAHGAGLLVESEPGRGSRFVVWLPRSEVPAEVAASSGPRPELAAELSVLVVDDELAIRQALERMLQSRGVEVVSASHGQEALERMAERRFQLVFLDLTMPVLGGAETLARIRQRTPEQRVVLMSGFDRAQTRARAEALGAFGVLAKPFELADVDALLARASSPPI